jgi:hypothetical protein
MRVTCGDESLVDHEIGLGERGLDIAVRPFDCGLTHRQLALCDGREIACGPFDTPRLNTGPTAADVVAARTPIRPARIEALERIDRERQDLEIDLDAFDRILRRRLIDRGQGQNWVTDKLGLIGHQLADAGVVSGQNAENAVHRERLGGIDIANRSVWNRACEQPRENHAFGTEVLGKLGFTGDFASDIRRREILTDQTPSHNQALCAARITALR